MMNNTTINLNSSDFIFFDVLNASNTARYIALAYSIVTFFVNTPLIYLLIQLELECHNRTLINRLIGGYCINGFTYNITVQVLEIIRYIYGPFPNFLCNLVYLIRNICPLQLILFLNASFVIRYVYVFHSKNPTAYQDDFFIFFLSIWTYSFATICQAITLYLPGRDHMMYYYCLGQMPSALLHTKFKRNTSFNTLILLTIVINLAIQVKIWIFKGKRPKTELLSVVKIATFRQQIEGNFVKLYSFRVQILLVAMIFLSGLAPNVINTIEPANINVFPNYLWVYLHNNITIQTFEFLCIIDFIKKHYRYRNKVKNIVLSVISKYKQLFQKCWRLLTKKSVTPIIELHDST